MFLSGHNRPTPLLPGDVWRKIIAYVYDPTIDGWTTWLFRIGAVSRIHQQIIRDLFTRYLSGSTLNLAGINNTTTTKWNEYRLMSHLTRHFPRIPAGYVEFHDYGNEKVRFPSFREIPYAKSEKFFEQKFMKQRFFVTDDYTEVKWYSRDEIKDGWAWPITVRSKFDISEKKLPVPTIFIPIPARHHSLPSCAAFVLHGVCRFITFAYYGQESQSLNWVIEILYNSSHWSAREMMPSDGSQLSQHLNTMQVLQIVQYIICSQNQIPETIKELLDLAAQYPGRADYNPNIIEQNEYTDWLASTTNL